MFYSGQKVVCVDAKDTRSCGGSELSEGRIYTVRGVGVDRGTFAHPRYGIEGLCLKLFEASRWDGSDTGFSVRRFRPLAEPKTDISIFHKVLTGDLVTEEA